MTEPVQVTQASPLIVEVTEATPLAVLVEEADGTVVPIELAPVIETLEVSIPGPRGPQGVPGPPGAEGPQGPSGPDTPTYTHTQDAASDTWIMDHGLGKKPFVLIEDTAGTIMDADMEYPTLNRAIAYHSTPFSGTAYLS